MFCAGGAAGWFAGGAMRPCAGPTQDTLLADINRAYDGRARARDPLPTDRAEGFAAWIGRSFARRSAAPGAGRIRLQLPWRPGDPRRRRQRRLFQFECPGDASLLAVFFWTTPAPPRLALDDFAARLWSKNGISFAVVERQGEPRCGGGRHRRHFRVFRRGRWALAWPGDRWSPQQAISCACGWLTTRVERAARARGAPDGLRRGS